MKASWLFLITHAASILALNSLAQAQLLLPTPELRTLQDCDTCPEMVILPDGTYMSRAPVTLGEFRVFAKATDYVNNGWGCKWFHPGFEQTERHPAVPDPY